MTLISLLFLMADFAGNGHALQVYSNIPEDAEAFLNNPYDMDYGDDGRLYVVDRDNHMVVVWNADGSFAKSFGRMGQGPGELDNPWRIKAAGSEVYVYSNGGRRMSVFDSDGVFKRVFRPEVTKMRNFAVLSPQLLLVCTELENDPTNMRVVFRLLDGEGKLIRELKNFKNSMFLAPPEGNNNAPLKAYSADGDIQYDGKGTWYFGYGSEPRLYRVNQKGEMLEPLKFEIPTAKPDQDEKDVVNNMSFPMGSSRIALKDLPNLRMHFNYDKDYFTQFVVKGDQVLFALSPIGGTNGVGLGFSNCSYVVCNLKDGKAVKRGRYTYPEDSRILFNDGHTLGMLLNEDDEFEIVELALPGMKGFVSNDSKAKNTSL